VLNTQLLPDGSYKEGCAYAYQADPENNPGQLFVVFEEGGLIRQMVAGSFLT